MPRWIRSLLSAVVGVFTAIGEAGLLIVAAASLVKARHDGSAGDRSLLAGLGGIAIRVAEWERRRLGAPPGRTITVRRAMGFLTARLLPGALGLFMLGLLAVGTGLAAILIEAAVERQISVVDFLVQDAIGIALLFINLQAIVTVDALDRWLARRILGPSAADMLAERVDALSGVIEAVDAERRRIERDLHDGLQQRLVAQGMLLGRARRTSDPELMRELVQQAHEGAQKAIEDLREVAWRVYPSALDHTDLNAVLSMVAQRSAVPVRIVYTLTERPGRQVETVLYFVACEAITNAAKHSGAELITVEIGPRPGGVGVLVRDEGSGGADPAGSGLQGLSRRVAALDGRFHVDSPPGGPTTVLAELPCA